MEAAELRVSAFNPYEVRRELDSISDWWITRAPDPIHGGFFGEIDHFANPVEHADKGSVLNTRILWFFSELAGQSGSAEHLEQAHRSYQWLVSHLLDAEYGGLVWSVDRNGQIADGKKQTYAQCFGIYALSSYYRLTGNPQALEMALSFFSLVEQHTRDRKHGGYVEACNRQWQAVSDFRLSDKDLNYPKSMNTHLHVLEAYAALYRVNPVAQVEEALRHVLDVFIRHILCLETHHLKLFFDMQWQDRSQTYSFGHDIEASWLLWEAALALGDADMIARVREISVGMANVCAEESIGQHGQVCDDYDFATRNRDEKSYWWVQAEALVGFMNAYLLTSEHRYFELCSDIWRFIQQNHLDPIKGEWHWLALCDQSNEPPIYKAGFWKAPYHNGRAMMELGKLFSQKGRFSC